MVMKKKHIKNKMKLRMKREAEKKQREPDVDFDTSAYVIYNRLEMTYPCLSFDIVQDNAGNGVDRVSRFPLSLKLVAGAQTPAHVENNYIYVMNISNIKPLKQENEAEDEEEEEGHDEEEDPNDAARLLSVRVAHKGCVNRIRTSKLGGKVLSASWSDKGKVHIFDLTIPLQAVEDQKSINTFVAQKVETKPIFTFGGHLSEGYAVEWSPHKLGSLATGDCKKNIHIWSMRNQSDWIIDQQPLIGHENSVEDIKWSPDDTEIMASCSVDKSIRLWDLRNQASSRCINKLLDAHKSDVNVIDWNKCSKHLIVSGGDDGVVKIWDMRMIRKDDTQAFPVAHFDYHKKPITSVEWDPYDDTVMAVSSDDDKLTIWDLAVEKDDEQEEDDTMEVDNKASSSDDSDENDEGEDDAEDDEDEDSGTVDQGEDKGEDGLENEDGVEYGDLDFKKIPEQMLFLHQGQTEIKELHWHPQLKGLIISTASNGLNLFKTISA